jgi:hypothetical protein
MAITVSNKFVCNGFEYSMHITVESQPIKHVMNVKFDIIGLEQGSGLLNIHSGVLHFSKHICFKPYRENGKFKHKNSVTLNKDILKQILIYFS